MSDTSQKGLSRPDSPSEIRTENVGGKTVYTGEGKATGPDVSLPLASQPMSMVQDSTIAPAPFGQAIAMQIVASHARAMNGHNIDVAVTAGTKGGIQTVTATLDGVPLLSEYFAEPRQSYHHHFDQVGAGSPGRKHNLEVASTDVTGDRQLATDQWEDLN